MPSCRICQGEGKPLIRPCHCEGSMAYVHPYCLAEWIASHGQLSCEVCGVTYTFQLVVNDTPSLRSVRGVARLLTLFVKRQLLEFFGKVGAAGQLVVSVIALTLCTTAIWFCCWRCVARRTPTSRRQPIPVPVLLCFGFLLNIIAGGLLLLYERFTIWAIIYEDEVADLLPQQPVQLPPEAQIDEAAATALNNTFTNTTRSRGGDDACNGASPRRFVSIRQSDMSSSVVLELLRKKVSRVKGAVQRRHVWDSVALQYLAPFLLVHLALAAAFVVGDTALQGVAFFTRLYVNLCNNTAVGRNSVVWALLTEALTATPLALSLYWSAAFVVGVMTLLFPLRLAAARLAGTRAQLSRTVLLSCAFSRGAISVVLLAVVWAIVVPAVVYGCLFPFFVESDATILMPPKEAWHILRSERLLPFQCRGASSTASPQPRRALAEPLNVIRALFFITSDVWHGQAPPLFEPVSCRLEASSGSPQQQYARVLHYLCFCGCVLLRVCTPSTWLALVCTLRATFLWLLSGTLTMLLPYTSLGKCFHDQRDFFHAYIHLKGKAFWRVLLEIPIVVALYASTVGFATFVTLYHFSPEVFPRSVSYLSFYTLTYRFSELDFVYCWYRVISATHREVQSVLQRLFFSRHASWTDDEVASPGSQTVEKVAYSVCLLCANVLIGALLEWASWNPWFPIVGFFLNLGCLSWLGLAMGGGLRRMRRRLVGFQMQLTMLCFYGTRVTFKHGDLCACRKLLQVRINVVTSKVLRDAILQNDALLLHPLTCILDHHHREAVVVQREVLQRITSHTLSHVATYPRMATAVLLAIVGPLVLCSAWHLNVVTLVSTDYMALPLWFSLLARWVIGALAGATWLFIEGCVLHTALFRRCLEFAPHIILGTPSLETVHAVLIPLVIHCGAVRLAIAGLEYFSDSTLSVLYGALSVAALSLVAGVAMLHEWLRNELWHAVRDLMHEGPAAAPPARPAAPRNEHPQAERENDQRREQPAAELAAVAPDAAAAVAPPAAPEAVNREQADDAHDAVPAAEERREQRPPPELQPPLPQKQSFLSRVQAYITDWAASECATDVVLVDREHEASSSADI